MMDPYADGAARSPGRSPQPDLLERLQEMFQQAPAAVAVFAGKTHVCELANDAYLELIGHRTLIGRPIAEALPEIVEQGFVALLDRVYETGEPYVGNAVPVQLRRRAAAPIETRAIDFVLQPIRSHVGEVTCIFVQGTDVTDRARAEEQLRQAQKMEAIGQLTGGIAHDFNNMLAVVMGGVSLLQRRLARGDTDVAKYIDAVMEGVNRAAALTQRLLAFARQQPLVPEPLDANRLVAGMAEPLHRVLGADIRVETVLAADLWNAKVDPSQLENAILNVAVNARDAMPNGGGLRIETSNARVGERQAREFSLAPGEYVLTRVTDTGTGMTPEVAAKAFDPFFTTKEVGKGTGLGLSQVFGFVRQSGGHVMIDSSVGHGTTIAIYLPRHSGAVDVDVASDTAPIVSGRPEEVLLVVEDEPRVRGFSVEALRELGYTVLSADGPDAALLIIDSGQHVDLLFTDLVMPQISGPELAVAVKERAPGVKVLFTTGFSRSTIDANTLTHAGAHLLSKPFGIDQLAAKVRGVLDALD